MKYCTICKKESNNVNGNYCVFCGGKLLEKDNVIKYEKETKKEESQFFEENQGVSYEKNINRNLKITLIIFILLFIIVSSIAIHSKLSDKTSLLEKENHLLQTQINNLKSEKNKLYSENTSLRLTNSANERKIKFFDENIVFVLEGYGRYYYTYDQVEQVTQGKSFSYWAYNKEQAINLGYIAWE